MNTRSDPRLPGVRGDEQYRALIPYGVGGGYFGLGDEPRVAIDFAFKALRLAEGRYKGSSVTRVIVQKRGGPDVDYVKDGVAWVPESSVTSGEVEAKPAAVRVSASPARPSIEPEPSLFACASCGVEREVKDGKLVGSTRGKVLVCVLCWSEKFDQTRCQGTGPGSLHDFDTTTRPGYAVCRRCGGTKS
jgi:hypothetical protein